MPTIEARIVLRVSTTSQIGGRKSPGGMRLPRLQLRHPRPAPSPRRRPANLPAIATAPAPAIAGCHDVCIDNSSALRLFFTAMNAKSQHVQIRVTPRQKTALKRLAAAAGQDVSSYVLGRVLPSAQRRFEELLALLGEGDDHRYVLAELNDLLTGLTADELGEAIEHADVARLDIFLQNYVAAMVEQASDLAGIRPPAWTTRVAALEAPWFASELKGLRLHLLRASPVPFKRRNLFVDAAVGARV